MTPGLTVVICTYLRPEVLGALLGDLQRQTRMPDALVVIDASPDDRTAALVTSHPYVRELGAAGRYHHCTEAERGLPRQRNQGLALVDTDLVVFFDDDLRLAPGTLAALEGALRTRPDLVGVGCPVRGHVRRTHPSWRLRRWLGIVPGLEPGRYHRSGFSTPWEPLPAGPALVEGDWLPGAAMCWRTLAAREEGFRPAFSGYAQGEDLEFSLRMRRHGRLALLREPAVTDVHAGAGRPDARRTGYMEIYNRALIHRDAVGHARRRDVLWFRYAWTMDSVLLLRHLLVPGRWRWTLGVLRGRAAAARDLRQERIGGRT